MPSPARLPSRGVYVALVLTWFEEQAHWRSLALAGVMLALAVVLTIAGPSQPGLPVHLLRGVHRAVASSDVGMPAVIVCAALACGTTVVAGGGTARAAASPPAPLASACSSLLCATCGCAIRSSNEARAELALSAVAAERERFARDLHDLLGHSLSVIASRPSWPGG